MKEINDKIREIQYCGELEVANSSDTEFCFMAGYNFAKQLSLEAEYQLQEFREMQPEYFDETGRAYQVLTYKTYILEHMLKLINQLESELINRKNT